MHIRIRLLLMKEIDRRNEARIEAFKKPRKRPAQPRKVKGSGRRHKPRK